MTEFINPTFHMVLAQSTTQKFGHQKHAKNTDNVRTPPSSATIVLARSSSQKFRHHKHAKDTKQRYNPAKQPNKQQWVTPRACRGSGVYLRLVALLEAASQVRGVLLRLLALLEASVRHRFPPPLSPFCCVSVHACAVGRACCVNSHDISLIVGHP